MSVSLIGDGVFLVATAWTAYELWNTPAALSVIGIAMTVPDDGVPPGRRRRQRPLRPAARDAVGGRRPRQRDRSGRRPCLDAYVDVPGIDGDGLGVRARRRLLHTSVRVGGPGDRSGRRSRRRTLSTSSFGRSRLRLVGPALGGWLVGAFGAGTAFALDAASFAASAVTVLSMIARSRRSRHRHLAAAEVHEGFRFVRRRRWLWGTLTPRRSPISSSSGRPRCFSPTSSRTLSTAPQSISESSSPQAVSARSARRP